MNYFGFIYRQRAHFRKFLNLNKYHVEIYIMKVELYLDSTIPIASNTVFVNKCILKLSVQKYVYSSKGKTFASVVK